MKRYVTHGWILGLGCLVVVVGASACGEPVPGTPIVTPKKEPDLSAQRRAVLEKLPARARLWVSTLEIEPDFELGQFPNRESVEAQVVAKNARRIDVDQVLVVEDGQKVNATLSLQGMGEQLFTLDYGITTGTTTVSSDLNVVTADPRYTFQVLDPSGKAVLSTQKPVTSGFFVRILTSEGRRLLITVEAVMPMVVKGTVYPADLVSQI
ncbi:MAG: hypothetical protein AB7P04_06190 [Bacteriovoracia bacterium]